MTTHKFKNKKEAVQAGYRQPGSDDEDVSGPNSFGYVFEDKQGNQTVDVWLTDVENEIGGNGAILPMFPPRE